MSERRACVLAGNYRPEAFGIGRYVPHYVDALAAAGWAAEVFVPFPFYPAWRLDRTPAAESMEEDGRVRIHRYAPFVPRQPTGAARALHDLSLGWHAVRSLAHAAPADLFVAASPPLLGAAATVRAARRWGRPSLVLAYDLVGDLAGDTLGPVAGLLGRGLRMVEARMYAGAGHVIALTTEMAQRIQALSGRTAPVSVLRIWADDGLFALDHAAAASSFRERWGVSPTTRLIGFAGNFGRKQQLPLVAEAAAGLPDGFSAFFIGDGPHRADLERVGAAHPARLRVLSPVVEQELYAFLSACDASLVVAWTTHGGSLFPSKVANILAAGCPIVAIAPPESELAQLVSSEGLGVLCPSLDPEALRTALRTGAELGRDPDRRERCRRYARAHLRREAVTARFVEEARRLVP